MSAGLVGALVGLAVAIADLLFLRALAARVDLPETRRVLNVTAAIQFIALPVMGYVVAPYLAGD